ncbi:MAG: AAA family ATPase [Pirellulaceae bacterium]|nr:AAA family ATPase [Pirellulaceae bacterium]
MVGQLCRPDAYRYEVDSEIVVHETHISWVILAGEFAHKIKKPIKTPFLDYSTLKQRKFFCHEEIRLDSRFSDGLYLGVVAISFDGERFHVEESQSSCDPIVDYAVKMRRFPADALLSQQLKNGAMTNDDVLTLAAKIASFHDSAEICRVSAARRLATEQVESHRGESATSPQSSAITYGTANQLYQDAIDNLRALESIQDPQIAATVQKLADWSQDFYSQHTNLFQQRLANGFIRECHGDLHLDNIVRFRESLTPFDGIEFCDSFRWIDTLSDSAFLTMDLAAHGYLEQSRIFINAYLEQSGDYNALSVLRWYLVYRALVRAKIATIRSQQLVQSADFSQAMSDSKSYIDLAHQYTLAGEPRLWITHGVSGSGKSTQSALVVQRCGAIRLRSDVQRKRHYGMSPMERPGNRERPDKTAQTILYSQSATDATYQRLADLARSILHAGFSVIVDATFLRRDLRERFRQLAVSQRVEFGIVDCDVNETTLRQRITDRAARNDDPSDADLQVMELQLATRERLVESEHKFVIKIPDLVSTIQSL